MGLINMAAKGRNGDTRMAHVTPGEVVIPKEVAALRPDLVAHVSEQVRRMGGNPESLTVGRGRINPQTGAEEFATQAEVEKAYRDTLGREPDAGGLAYWMGQGNLDAFKSVAAPEIADKVDTSYQTNFGRDADTVGSNYWKEQVSSGNIGSVADLNKTMLAGAQGDDITANKDGAQYPTAWATGTNPNSQLTYDADKNQWNPVTKKPVIPTSMQQANVVTPTQTMRTVDPGTETVAGQVRGIIAENSPLAQQAVARADQRMNERGLLNSSMSTGAAMSALYDYAVPIGTADANVYGNAANTNVNTANDFSKTNAAAQNQINQFNVSQENAWKQANLTAETQRILSESDANKGVNMQMQQAIQGLQNTYAVKLAEIMASTTMDAASKTAAKNQIDTWLNNSISQQGSIAGINLDSILLGV